MYPSLSFFISWVTKDAKTLRGKKDQPEFPKTWYQAQFRHQMLFKNVPEETRDIQHK